MKKSMFYTDKQGRTRYMGGSSKKESTAQVKAVDIAPTRKKEGFFFKDELGRTRFAGGPGGGGGTSSPGVTVPDKSKLPKQLQIWWISKRGGYETLQALRNDEPVPDKGQKILDELNQARPYYGTLYRGALYEHPFNSVVSTSLNDNETRDYGKIQYIIDCKGVRALHLWASSESEVILDKVRTVETRRNATTYHGRPVTYIWVDAYPIDQE